MRPLVIEDMTALLAHAAPPCISLYQPTHRHHPDNQQDPIRYRNILRDMESSLKDKHSARETQALLDKFQALAHDGQFWNHRTDGLAVFASPAQFHVFDLQRPVKELIVVANSFHIKPLLRIIQSSDRFQILSLNRHEAKLYEGNRDALDPVEMPFVPSTITEALGAELTEPSLTFGGHAGARGQGQTAMYSGKGAKADEVDIDMDRFFRAIDQAILKHHSRPSGLPLMLVALTEYHAPFREVSHNPFLMNTGIQMNANELSMDQLRKIAWQVLEPGYLERLAKLVENFQFACSRQLGSADLAEAAQATAAGRVDSLLVEADRTIPGRIDPVTGRIESGNLTHPEIDDVLDDLAEAVLRMKGKVVVVPTEQMPSDTGVAATYRY